MKRVRYIFVNESVSSFSDPDMAFYNLYTVPIRVGSVFGPLSVSNPTGESSFLVGNHISGISLFRYQINPFLQVYFNTFSSMS